MWPAADSREIMTLIIARGNKLSFSAAAAGGTDGQRACHLTCGNRLVNGSKFKVRNGTKY